MNLSCPLVIVTLEWNYLDHLPIQKSTWLRLWGKTSWVYSKKKVKFSTLHLSTVIVPVNQIIWNVPVHLIIMFYFNVKGSTRSKERNTCNSSGKLCIKQENAHGPRFLVQKIIFSRLQLRWKCPKFTIYGSRCGGQSSRLRMSTWPGRTVKPRISSRPFWMTA